MIRKIIKIDGSAFLNLFFLKANNIPHICSSFGDKAFFQLYNSFRTLQINHLLDFQFIYTLSFVSPILLWCSFRKVLTFSSEHILNPNIFSFTGWSSILRDQNAFFIQQTDDSSIKFWYPKSAFFRFQVVIISMILVSHFLDLIKKLKLTFYVEKAKIILDRRYMVPATVPNWNAQNY